MSEPTKWRYGAQWRINGAWIWPRGCWEYSLEEAQAKALLIWPHVTTVAVEPLPPAQGERWICDRGREGRNASWHLAVPPSPPAPREPAIAEERKWWLD